MVRKRSRYTRARAKRRRPKTPAPRDGWLIAELAELSKVSIRTLRSYVSRGLLRHTEFRGTLTRYPRSELVRLLGVLRLRAESKETLSAIKRRLDAQSEVELEAWLRTAPLSSALEAALGIARHDESPFDAALEPAPGPWETPSSRDAARSSSAKLAVETWQSIQLLPGLALILSADASPAAWRLAQTIVANAGRG